MNLLDEKWIPIRRANGQHDWISAFQISEPDIVALDARRPDFNGALIQFLIGLIQTTTPMDSESEWEEWDKNPPSKEVLRQWFAPVRDAFVFDGDGARFMQELGLSIDGKSHKKISQLLVDFPGEKTIKDNTDHFVKRNMVDSLCRDCAALALFALQTNAPSGGAGQNTSIRGGGPLTSLVLPSKSSVWSLVWLNIKQKSHYVSAYGNQDLQDLEFTFPWLTEIDSLQKDGSSLSSVQMHPFHMFWGMPRRIRLDFESECGGKCSGCGRSSEHLISKYVTVPSGINYKGDWIHPLSPYYKSEPGMLIPVHPQPGGFGYKHWLAWVMGIKGTKHVQPASIVSYVFESRRIQSSDLRLWVFGYDIYNNMKVRCWYESTLPLYGLTEKNIDGRNLLQREVTRWVEAADHAVFLLRSAVKSAWFGDNAEARGDFSFIDSHFWAATEKQFYPLLRHLIEQARDKDDDPVLPPLREQWRSALATTAETLFDADFIGVAPIEQQNPRRIAEAFNRFRVSLRGDKLKTLLKLPVEKPEKSRKKTAKSAA